MIERERIDPIKRLERLADAHDQTMRSSVIDILAAEFNFDERGEHRTDGFRLWAIALLQAVGTK